MNVNLPGLESKGFILREPSERKKPDGGPAQSRLRPKAAGRDFQRILRQRRGVRRVGGEPGEGIPHAFHEARFHVFEDEYDPRRVVGIGPGFEPRRRMENMLHAVDDERPRRIIGERDNALHPQQMRAMGRAQQFEKHIDRAGDTGAG